MEWDISAECVSVIMLNIYLHSDKYFVNPAAGTAFSIHYPHQSGAPAFELHIHTAYGRCVLYLYADHRI